MLENKQNEADWLGLERIVPDFGQEGGAGMDISSFHHSAVACSGVLAGAVDDLGEARAGKGKGVIAEGGASGMCTVEHSLGGMEQWDISFGDLLALAEAASTTVAGGLGHAEAASTTVAGGLGHIGSSRGDSSSNDFGLGPAFQFHGGCTTKNNILPVPTPLAYDLNFPPGIMENEVSTMDMPQFAPVTPCKIGIGEIDNVSEAQEKENQGENENEVIVPGAVTNRLEGPSQPDSSVLAVYEEGGTEMLELNKTPQQKPKRRKHRPKVVREDKPKQTPKPAVTPKENPTVKRKYVRKANKPATTTPAEIRSDPADPEALESRPAKNSCRRELKFDVQGQQQEETATQRSFSELREENTRARIVIDLTCSEVLDDHSLQPTSITPNDSTCSTSTALAEEERARRPKRNCAHATEEEASDTNRNGVQFNNLQFYASLLQFPNIYKKRRSEKGQNSTTCNAPSGWNSALQFTASGVLDKLEPGRDLQGKDQTLRLTKRRTKTVTRVRDLASLNKFAESQMQPHTCIESLVADMSPALAKRKRSRTRNYVSGVTLNKNKMSLHQQIVLYKHQQSAGMSSGGHRKVILWQDLVDAVTEQFQYLDINRETHREINQERNVLVPYNQDRNALVLYRRNGTIVPFQGPFSPIKKRHLRPKVELDDETTKVWRLLLENINNEGVDGTDEEKRKWWEEERRVFRGRADSFIARMHLVQGDRRFSRWKGSVVDSVIGVFLTQNVSDHLSSSAFMSLAARYPLKPERNHNPFVEVEEEEEATLLVKEPEVCMLDPEQTIEWKKKIPNQQVCDQSSVTLPNNERREEKEDVNSNISTIEADSSHNSVNSSQNSVNVSYSEPKLKNRIEPTFTELLKMAGSNMLHEVSSQRNEDVLSGENCKDVGSTSGESILTVESGQEIVTVQESSTSCSGNNQETLNSPNLSVKTLDVTESTVSTSDKNTKLKAPVDKALKEINAAKQKSRRVGREIRSGVDWDALRSGAEANGKKREKTPNTMDSLDWEAVRCADVNEIAETIKERGMNHMLAERIKAFLNRLVKDHGSIDLEWLRDVSPDEAKEYLLSIRGLGLKSVECVRLLTLHHLAFPVDTNVGRIAVRLGWVPLQPLPESLQLHLLELYPVLESIQKYLWPRLCKLEQTQLYELHYQMITFGKVFCTKSKPNCNACPMRGECRHFASAFASARLALPAPEEKSIVPATDQKTATPDNNNVRVNGLPLPPPPPQAIQQLEGSVQLEAGLEIIGEKSVAGSCEPIIEEPASPEPEITQELEHDIEDALYDDDPNEIPTIKLNIEEFTQNLQNYMEKNMELQAGEMSKALVALTPEAASLPTPKLKNVSRLRTEHQVYELPDSHPLLEGMDKREPDDPCSYLLAIWTPGETATSIQPPEGGCQYEEFGKLCDQKTCFSCNSIREANSQVVRGTLLIPCRTAMRGSFPLNGTYFQVNEVFADHDSSLSPIDVPRSWLWNLPRRTVYFGTSVPSIFKGLPTEGIQHCFWRGYVCVRGFDQKTRAPRPLMARLHFPASKLTKSKGKAGDE